MEGSQLITGNKYDQVVRFILILFFVITGGGVVFAISGGKIKPAVVEKQVTIQAVSEVTPEVLSESNLGNQPYLVIARTNGEYAFVKVQNAQIQNEKYVDLTELVYQNGEAKLTQEIKGTVNIYDDDNRVIENAMIVLHGVVGITLTDGTTLPVKIINGRINGGKMVGDVDLRSLKDNSQILGTIDTRGNFENISITPSLQEVDIATAAVGKEVFKWLDQAQETVTVILPGAEISPTPSVVSGAITIDPVTGLAIINSGVVGDAQIVNGSITTLKLADGAVTTIKLADSAVTGAKITDGTITSGKIGDGEITNAKLAQITEANKVSGAAVSLRGGGGLTNDSGLSLLTGCSIDQVLSWDGDSWECQSVSGVGTGVSSINSLTGGLTITGSGLNTVTASGTTINIAGVLPSVGTAGTYGTATDIPVLTTDANGRVSGVTNTAISGLTSANLAASAGITNGQLSNSSIFVSPGSGISVSGSPVSLGGTVTIAGVDASTTLKGVANYNSTNFSVVSGSVNTIQNIDSTATPTFNSLTLTKVNNQLVLGTTNTTTISSTAPSASRTATIPALSGNDTFVFLNESGTLTNKTIAAGANTISGLTNSNLSGTAGITDANLATITTANKVSGSAVQLSTGGGLVDSTGLSLLRTCASGEILKYNGTSWVCNTDSTSGSPTLNANGGLVNDSGLSLLRTCSDNQILKWTAATGWTCSADSTGGGSVTVAESDGSPSVGAVTTLQFGPATTSSEEFVITDQTGGVARIRTGTKVVLTDNRCQFEYTFQYC
ncbi:MAG: Protein H02F09.3 [Candidatus Collierbacteria bacterium GW2011_GWD2_42_50]|nr:MAG: Protein H02F09.3 [Candidatus Collierbacteria bacterium GW2011_GWD2_42_50]